MTDPGEYTAAEMMIVASARQLAGERVCFVGVGPPNIYTLSLHDALPI